MARLEHNPVPGLDPYVVARDIQIDRIAIERQLAKLKLRKADVRLIFYEDLFATAGRALILDDLFNFLNLKPDLLSDAALQVLDPPLNKWSSMELYRSIPNIDAVERLVGSDETGWLSR